VSLPLWPASGKGAGGGSMPLLQEVPELVVPDRSCCVSLEMIVVGEYVLVN
jgi:hypothetical protein